MLKGIDVSKWQKLNDYGDSVELGHTDFMIVKATEGKTYNDPMFEYHIVEAIRRGMLITITQDQKTTVQKLKQSTL